MPKYNKEYYKQYIGNNDIEKLINELLQHLQQYLSFHPKSHLQNTYDALIMQLGKWKSILHEEGINIVEPQAAKREKARISQAVLGIINGLPTYYFDFLNGDKKAEQATSPDLRQQVQEVHKSSAFEYDVFFSFSGQDFHEAKRICEELRGYGLHVFLTDETLKANTGSSFFERIGYALENSQHFILLSSVDSMTSEWVKTEYETFYNEYFIKDKAKRRFIILKSKNFSIGHVPILLKRLQFANNPKEILATFIKDKRFQDRQAEKKRQAAAQVLEQQAIEEKRRREEQALQEKALEEQRKKEAARLQQEQENQRQAEQQALQEKALQEKRERDRIAKERLEREKELQSVAKQLAVEKRKKKEQRKAAWADFWDTLWDIRGLWLFLLFIISGPICRSKVLKENGGEDIVVIDVTDTLESPEIITENSTITAKVTYNNLVQEADNYFNKKDYDNAKMKYNTALSAAKGFDFDTQKAADGVKNCEVETKKIRDQQSDKEKLKPVAPSLSPIIIALENNMKTIPSGIFTMGCTSEQSDCDDDEKPTHKVSISSFKINKYEVTQEEWRAVMGSDPPKLHFKGCNKCPVEKVSWNDIQDFLKKLNQLTGKSFRLPSEAEWEYAARGNEKYKYAGSNDIDLVAWYTGNSSSKTHAVGGKKANGFGLYDMSGNVYEWCQDNSHNDYKGAPNDGRAWTSSSSSTHVVRGGSWNLYAQYCRVADRHGKGLDDRSFSIGFRLAHR